MKNKSVKALNLTKNTYLNISKESFKSLVLLITYK